MEEFEIKNNVLVKYNGTAEDVTIPDGVEKIGQNAFLNFKTMKSLTIPSSVKEIARSAFESCASLEQVVLSEGLEKIGEKAFADCYSLKKVSIPASVKELQNVFEFCESLEQVDLCDGLETMEGTFHCCGALKSIVIPSTVKKINAFCGCGSLEEIILPEGLEKIGGLAFYVCKSLKTITIPASVKEIGVNAFGRCTSLEQVVLSEGLERIGQYVFLDCVSLKTITIPASVKEICRNAFLDCKSLNQIILSKGLERIGESAFSGCESLKTIAIPDSVKQIEHGAFDLKSITFEGAAPNIGKNAFGKVEVIFAPHASAVDFSEYKEAYLMGFLQLLKEGSSLDKTIVEKTKKNIKLNAQKLCGTKDEELFSYMLRNALIPLNIVDEFITKYNEEKNVARVAALIDYKEKNFTEKQKEEQFNKQFELREPTFAELRKVWAFSKKEDGTYQIFGYKGKDVETVVPAMIREIKVTQIGNGKEPHFGNSGYENAFKKVKSIIIQKGVESIADYAFEGCRELQRVVLPEGLKTIGKGAFKGCTSLKEIIIPASVEKMGIRVFYDCYSLKHVVLPKGLESIDYELFHECSSLEQIILPEGLKKIDKYAFGYCDALKTITIPSSVQEIGHMAFYACHSLKEIVLPEGSEIKIDPSAFADCFGLKGEDGFAFVGNMLVAYIGNEKKVSVPPKTTAIGGWAFHGKDITQVTLSEGVETIGARAFHDCKSLKSINIPASVKEIAGDLWENGTFSGCESLEQVVLSEGLNSIGSYAFHNCKSLKSIIIPASVKEIGGMAFGGCSNLTIYVRCKKRPKGWDEDWNRNGGIGNMAKVIWGYKDE